jgi:hypothetical protein
VGFIGKVFKGVGKAVGGLAKGVAKFAKSPLGKVLLGVGLTALTGGAGAGIFAKALVGSKLGSLGTMFSGVASKFLGSAANLLSKAGLSTLGSFAKQALNSGDLLGMVKNLMTARANSPQQVDPTTNAAANYNIAQMMAFMQWQLQLQGDAQQ